MMPCRNLIALAAALLPVGAFAQVEPDGPPLTPQQVEIVGTITYLQVARRACGYTIEPDRLSILAQSGKLTFKTPNEELVAAQKLSEHYEKFSGVKQVLECDHALELYGPMGSAEKGVLRRGP